MHFPFSMLFSVSRHIPDPTMIFSFSLFVSFFDIFKVLHCVFLIFHLLQVSRHIAGPTVSISHFLSFSGLLSVSRSYSVCVPFSMFFQFSCHYLGPTLFISLIYRFSVFLAIFHVLQNVFLISHVFHCFLPYFMSHHVSFSVSSCVSFLAIFQFLQSVCIILHVFQCFSPYSRSYSVSVSFSNFFSFLATILVIEIVFLILHVLTVSRHITCPIVFVSHFARFQCISPYFMSYHVSFSFSTFFSFVAIFQVLECAIFIFHVFQCFLPYSWA